MPLLRSANQAAYQMIAVSVIIFTLATGVTSDSAAAENKPSVGESAPSTEPVRITADKLVSNAEEAYAEFTGNVKAIQGNVVITADVLRIYYQGDLVNPKNNPSDKQMIKKIVASGHVEIISDRYTAKTERLEYDLAAMVIVLSGENSTVTSGKNSITGSRITLYRADGNIKVEGSADRRVHAVFYAEGKEMEILKSGSSPNNSKNSSTENSSKSTGKSPSQPAGD
jgi:lipopolysaccharide export system protein LptA